MAFEDTLVHGWCLPMNDSEERFICLGCGTSFAIACTERFGDCPIPNDAAYWGAIPVTFNGSVKCSRCKRTYSNGV